MPDVIYIICVLSCVAFSSFSMYNGEENRGGRFALGIILLAALAVPILSSVKNISSIDFEINTEEFSSDITAQVASDSYCRGIKLAIMDKFSLSEDGISVSCESFSLEDMKAQKIYVILHGDAIYSDRRGIAQYVEQISECEVSVRFE